MEIIHKINLAFGEAASHYKSVVRGAIAVKDFIFLAT